MRVAYTASNDGHQVLWVHDLTTARTVRIGDGSFLDLHPKDVIMITRGAAHGLGEMDLSKVTIREADAS